MRKSKKNPDKNDVSTQMHINTKVSAINTMLFENKKLKIKKLN